MKVLIVDDAEDNLYLLETLLRNKGYHVTSARNGEEALECLRKDSFKLIISDILMPQMDGFQLCQHCKTDPQLKSIPFIFYSATYTDAKDEAFALGIGADKFIVKPAQPDRFFQIIEEVLREHQHGTIASGRKETREEEAFLSGYSKRLIDKLESKMLDLEKANKALGETERILRENEERLRGITKNLPGIIFQFYAKDSGEYGMSYASERLTELYGFPANLEALFPIFLSHLYEEDKDRFLSSIRKALETGTSWNFEGRLVMPPDEVIWVHGLATPTRHEDRVVFDGILLNITERKLAEEMIHQSKEKFTKVFMATPDCIVITRIKDGLIIDANLGFEEISGWKRSEAIGQTSIDINVWSDPSDRDFMAKELMAGRDVLQCESQFRRKDGVMRTVIYSARPIVIAGEACLIFVLQDITDRRRLEEERRKLEQQLSQSQKMDAIGQLAGGVAHDFNNILSAIMGYSDMALGEPMLDPRIRHYIEQVYKAGERAGELVNQILAFSHQSDEKPQPLRVSPIIREVLKLLRASLPTTMTIRQDIRSEPDTVLADPTQIHQILMNLCTNAAHAMRETKGELKVRLVPVEIKPQDTLIIHHNLSPGMYLKLTVSDTGHGIKATIMERIFDPFFTTKKPGEGTGMGLSVVHGIVKSYHGAITVESEVGKGTAFHVYLPLLKETGEEREVEAVAHITGGKERVLFVEDEDVLVQLGKEMLTGLGYEIVESTSSLEALKLFHSSPDRFDLVITDMTMPNMTGVELAQELMRIRPGIPVILCTGFSEEITPERAKSLGLREFIMKPMIKSQIAKAIRRVLDHRE